MFRFLIIFLFIVPAGVAFAAQIPGKWYFSITPISEFPVPPIDSDPYDTKAACDKARNDFPTLGGVTGPCLQTPGGGSSGGVGNPGNRGIPAGQVLNITPVDYKPLVSLPFLGSGAQTIGTYLLSIFQLLIGLSGIVAVVRMVTCGFQAIISVNPSAREHASECVVGAITGLLLIFSGWILLNQINPTLLKTDFEPPATQTSQGGGGGGSQGGPPAQCDTRNLCQGTSAGLTPCFSTNTRCSGAYSGYADTYAGGGISASMLREVMAQESSCDISRSSGVAYGLMQLKVDTAQMYRGACRITDTITSDWLRAPANAEASVCLAAAYLRSLYSGVCSGNIRQTLAGYNGGGPGACATMSQDCQNMNNCDGGTMRAWECPYEDPAHTICNTGLNSFQQTRNYVREILYCLP